MYVRRDYSIQDVIMILRDTKYYNDPTLTMQ